MNTSTSNSIPPAAGQAAQSCYDYTNQVWISGSPAVHLRRQQLGNELALLRSSEGPAYLAFIDSGLTLKSAITRCENLIAALEDPAPAVQDEAAAVYGDALKDAAYHPATMRDVFDALPTVRPFLSVAQLETIGDFCRGEEGQHFKDKIVELCQLITAMPTTYAQAKLGRDAVCYLHYFSGGNDWYITEKDAGSPTDTPEDFQSQAFGVAFLLGGYPEMGYISIPELVAAGVELDLYWTPKTLNSIEEGK